MHDWMGISCRGMWRGWGKFVPCLPPPPDPLLLRRRGSSWESSGEPVGCYRVTLSFSLEKFVASPPQRSHCYGIVSGVTVWAFVCVGSMFWTVKYWIFIVLLSSLLLKWMAAFIVNICKKKVIRSAIAICWKNME